MAKSEYAKYTFAFAGDVQKLADEKHIKVLSFSTRERKSSRGSYDVLEVHFLVPRPDRDVRDVETTEEPRKTLVDTIHELEEELGKGKGTDNEV